MLSEKNRREDIIPIRKRVLHLNDVLMTKLVKLFWIPRRNEKKMFGKGIIKWSTIGVVIAKYWS